MNTRRAILKNVVKMVKTLTAQSKEPVLVEACDFGKTFGFLFVASDKYENVYWCVSKSDYKPTTFVPSTDYQQYRNRTILPNEMWTQA